MNTEYYNGTKLLSLKDINGKAPEIYLCTTNRTGGKTTYFNRLCVNNFIKKKEKFCLLYRWSYELDSIAEKFFKDIQELFFQDREMKSEVRAKGMYHELYLGKKNDIDSFVPCGYAVALNNADAVKKNSHLFSDVKRILFDEFQSETNHYCSKEIDKFLSIHKSMARGQGKQWRYVPVYMISNPVTILNPYYVSIGITDRLRDDTRFLKGDGYVMEQGFNESAMKAQLESGVSRAFKSTDYVAYASQGVYLNDKKAFLENIEGRSKYLCTVRCDGKDFAIREYTDRGIIYCDSRVDGTFKMKLCITTEDHDVNYVMLKRNELFVSTLRFFFDHGSFRFKNLECKQAVLKMLSY